jgi:E3 ubiquitin-protein ligase HERC3
VAGQTPIELGGGDRQTCVRFSGGKIKCWGDNEYGQLGLGNTTTQGDDNPAEIAALPFVDLANSGTYVVVELPNGGSNYHNCAVLNTGAVKCWGRNNKQSDNVLGAPVPTGGGQLGLGDILARGDAGGEMGNALPAVDLTP